MILLQLAEIPALKIGVVYAETKLKLGSVY